MTTELSVPCTEPTPGSVTDTLAEASYDLLFGGSRVQGSFSAPTCTLCAPRPTARTCLRQ